MASKTGQEQASAEQVEELLDAVDQTLDRLKTLYEQYFLGIQKQAPAYIHNDVERKLRDLTQMNLRSTRLRYRLATLQQKFGSYNAYWRRTLRQIENGTYARNLAKIGREAAKNGSDIPEEILAAMPKRMREQVLRDRDAAIARAKRQGQIEETPDEDSALPDDEATTPAPAPAPAPAKVQRGGAHVLEEADGEIDFNEMFAAFEDDQPVGRSTRVNPTRPPINKPASARDNAKPPDASQSQQITQPITRPPTPHAPAASETAPTQALPRAAVPRPVVPAPGGIPQPIGQQPSGPTQGIPRAVGQQPSNATGAIPRPVPPGQTGGVVRPTPSVPSPATRQTGPVPVVGAPTTDSGAVLRPNVVQRQTPANIPPPAARQTGPVPVMTPPTQTGAVPRPTPPGTPQPTQRQTPVNMPAPPTQRQTGPVPPLTQPIPRPVPPSQQSRPIPVTPGAAAQTGPVPVESMNGPFPRSEKPAAAAQPPRSQPPAQATAQPQRSTQSIPRPAQPAAPLKPPPGMTEADVNALHAKYVKAKEMIGEKVDAGSREKLLKTINQTAPKIMEQYKASGVDFSVVVKDNQVVIKAKPKT